MTYFIPGIVIEVSAMLVARMHLRVFAGTGEKTFDCFAMGSAAYIAQVATWRNTRLNALVQADCLITDIHTILW